MLEPFFGMPQAFIRSGFCPKMKAGEIRLYLCLMHRSERNSSREVTMTDESVRKDVGAAPRTLCNARKKLQERGLIQCRRIEGNKYMYIICDPDTGKPYPGDPKHPVRYKKQSKQHPENTSKTVTGKRPILPETVNPPNTCTGSLPQKPRQLSVGDDPNMTEYGLAGVFEKSDEKLPF